MVDKILYVITVPMVYLAFACLVLGVIARIVKVLRSPAHPHTLKIFPERKAAPLVALWESFTMPTVRRKKPRFWIFLMLFHAGILVLILSHLDLLPQVKIMPKDSPHMIGWGAVGVVVTVSVIYLLLRRFASPVREVSVPADYLLLFLLFLTAVTGDTISWGNSWSEDGFVITKQEFGTYLNGLLHFTFEDPAETLYGSHYVVVAIHIFLANLFMMVLPFSKIMHTFFAVALNRFRRV
jgi:nitrate reductase gamma subunit